MATTIKLKNGSGAPAASDLVQGEPAFDLTNKRLYTEDSGGSVIEVGSNPSSLSINGTAVTATATEINTLDGITSTTAELNILDGVTSTAAELNILDGVTASTAEINLLDGVTATTAELNILDGVTATAAELNVLDGVTAFVDEDDMVSNSATSIPSQQSVKAYVDSTIASEVTAQDLDFQGDTGGALSIDLDSETLTIAGGTGIDTSGATNTLTVAIDSTVATLTDSQTLTNKTLTSPVLNTGVSGTAILDEDDMVSDSATQLATQQSIKAYVDSQVAGKDTLAELTDTNITTPADGALLLYDADNSEWIDNVVSGDITIADTGVAAISSGVIVNDDINASAAISVSKTALVDGTGLTLTDDTLSVDASQTQITAVGTIGTGTWQGTVITDTYVANDLTINGGTIENTPIGAATPNTGEFTTLTVSGDLTVDTDTLYVDSTNNRVGIGNENPQSPLQINNVGTSDPLTLELGGQRNFSAATYGATAIVATSNGTRGDHDFGAIRFEQNPATGDGHGALCRLFAGGASSSFASKNEFLRGTAVTTGVGVDNVTIRTNDTERMRIDSSGNVGIGESNPSYLLDLKGGTNDSIRLNALSGRFIFANGSGTDKGSLSMNGGNMDIAADAGIDFYSGGSPLSGDPQVTLDSSGNVTLRGNDLNLDNGTTLHRITNSNTDLLIRADYSNTTANSTIQFSVDGTERMRIDSSGNLLVGTTSSQAKLNVKQSLSGTYGSAGMWITDNATTSLLMNNVSSGVSAIWSSGALAFGSGSNNYSNAMTLTSGGDLLVGKTTTDFGTEGIILYGPSGSGSRVNITNDGNKTLNLNRLSSNGILVEFYKDGSSVGSISTNANSLPSDRNFKKNIKDLQLGLSFISSLKPVTYNYKMDDDSDPIMTGLIAQDVESALAEAGVEPNSMTLLQHKPVDDEKESDYQMDYSKLIPVLTKAIQEQQAMIETLQAQVAELQGAN